MPAVPDFAHLHVHTEYSLLDGISSIDSLVETAAKQQAAALAITDHGNLHGAVQFYSQCRAAGIKPIIGSELYVAHQTITHRGPEERQPHHLTVLAANNAGYANLVALVTASHHQGFYQKPRVDRDLLAQHAEGLIILSGCPSAQLPQLLGKAGGPTPEALAVADWYRATFPQRYFLELQRHDGIDGLEIINRNLVTLAGELNLPLVATNDSHYTHRHQQESHDLFLAAQTGTSLADPDRLRFSDGSYYLKSPAEMAELFADLPEALANAAAVAQQCSVDLDFSHKAMPRFPAPDGLNADQYLTRLCQAGFVRRGLPDHESYHSRLRLELEVIRQTAFADYFLIVWDLVRYARKQDILLGVRGSAAASLVLYCLDVTAADPIEHGLVFERFLNIERKEMPDIDLDLQDDRREEAINYAIDTYGQDRVAQIITFARYGPKSALKAAAKASDLSYTHANRLAQLVPARTSSLTEAVAEAGPLRDLTRRDPEAQRLFENAAGIERVAHQTGAHPAGIVISAEPLADIAPLQPPTGRSEGLSVTQYDMESVSRIGLLKMDFLGLTSFTILDRVMRTAPGAPDSLEEIPLDDPDTYALLASGQTSNVFQLESAGMQRYIAELRPQHLGDISAMIALYRPGPMDHIDRFIQSRHGRVEITYPHPSLRETLDETYGVIVYQDQVLRIMRDFAGYSLGQADIVRKAMGKKIPELLIQERQNFLDGAVAQGYDRRDAQAIFDLIEPFAGYAFNKAHSISYALLSYWTAWFKTNHPGPYMAAALNCRQDQNRDLYRTAVAECRRMGIILLPPCINDSDATSVPRDDGSIRLGLTAVAGVGSSAVAALIDERELHGPFSSLENFTRRFSPRNMSVKQFENLIQAGALDAIMERAHAVSRHQQIWDYVVAANSRRSQGQSGLFDAADSDSTGADWFAAPPDHRPATPREKGEWELKHLGISLSWSADASAGSHVTTLAGLQEAPPDGRVTVAGAFADLRQRTTKRNRPYLVATLNLEDGDLEVMLWENVVAAADPDLLHPYRPVAVTGRLSQRDEGEYSLSADSLADLSPAEADPILFSITSTGHERQDRLRMMRCLRIVTDYPGETPLRFSINLPDRTVPVAMPNLRINPADENLQRQLRQWAEVSPLPT